MSKFPDIENGSCDGLGCGGILCWCNENVAMKEEFQKVFDKAWDTKQSWEGQDIDCVNWERAWRFGERRTRDYYDPKINEARKTYRSMCDRYSEANRLLSIKVFQLEKKLKEL